MMTEFSYQSLVDVGHVLGFGSWSRASILVKTYKDKHMKWFFHTCVQILYSGVLLSSAILVRHGWGGVMIQM